MLIGQPHDSRGGIDEGDLCGDGGPAYRERTRQANAAERAEDAAEAELDARAFAHFLRRPCGQ